MTTWIDPTFGEALAAAGLVALGRVVQSDPRGAHVELLRVLAGHGRAGEVVAVRRSPVVGRGHEGSVLPPGATFAFVIRAGAAGYQAFTDSYWSFPISDGERVHMPVRDPFTRAYVPFDDLSELARLVRDRGQSPAAFLSRQCARLAQLPVAATQPIEVNDQILALESLALLGSPEYAASASPLLGSPHFQIRWSAARAVAACGGPRAARALLDLLAREDAPPVQAALAEALSGLADASMRDELQAALPRMYGSTMPYSRNLMSPIMNLMPCPRDALAAAIAKASARPPEARPASPDVAGAAARLRALVSTRNLLALCESTPAGAVPLVDDGKLVVLTSEENIPAFEQACAALLAARKLTFQRIEDGVGIFAHLPDAVTSVSFDPGAPSAEVFAADRVASLRDMARSVAVTRVAENPSAYDAASFRRIMREHRRFVVPLQPMTIAPTGGQVTALNVEIVDGRAVAYEILRHRRADGIHYAVAFTWPDCAEAFFAALGHRTRTVALDGEALFRELRRVEEAHGVTSIVLDMEGPTKQSWLKASAWRLVLD